MTDPKQHTGSLLLNASWQCLCVLVTQLCLTPCDTMDCSLPGSSVHEILQAKILEWGSHSLLRGIFPTQGSNRGIPHWELILYCLNHQGSPRILERVAYPFSSRSSWPRNQTGSPALQDDSLPTELSGKPQTIMENNMKNNIYIWITLLYTRN